MKIAFTTKKTGNSVLFNNISTAPSGTTWSWSFGDGEKSTEKAPTHAYSGPGFFLVELTAKYQTEDPIILNTVIVISDKVNTTLPDSIYNLIDTKLPTDLVTELTFNKKQIYIEKWQLFLQPLVNHDISLENYNDELYYEALENQLVLELACYDYMIDYINYYLFAINSQSVQAEGNKVVKRMTTGPSEVEWFDNSEINIEKLKTLAKYTQNNGYLDLLKSNICNLASRLDIPLNLCKEKTHRILPIVVKNIKDRPFEGPNPAAGLN